MNVCTLPKGGEDVTADPTSINGFLSDVSNTERKFFEYTVQILGVLCHTIFIDILSPYTMWLTLVGVYNIKHVTLSPSFHCEQNISRIDLHELENLHVSYMCH